MHCAKFISTPQTPEWRFAEAGLKFEARCFLIGCRLFPDRLAVPTRREYIGLNLLDRDGELNDNLSKWS